MHKNIHANSKILNLILKIKQNKHAVFLSESHFFTDSLR